MLPEPIAHCFLVGQSSAGYDVAVYALDGVADLLVAGVYVVLRKFADGAGLCKFVPVYVGATDEDTIAQRFSGGHDHGRCFRNEDAQFIGIVNFWEGLDKGGVEADLIEGLSPVCNVQDTGD